MCIWFRSYGVPASGWEGFPHGCSAKALGGLGLIPIKDVLVILHHDVFIMAQVGETKRESPGKSAQMKLEDLE